MEILNKTVEFVTEIFNNKTIKKFSDDFVTATVNWIRPIFLEDTPKLVEKLEVNPTDKQTQNRLATAMEDLLENDDFRIKILDMLNKGNENKQKKHNNSQIQGNENFVLQNLENSQITINVHKGLNVTKEKKKVN